ncbi:hypothetical protein EPO15_03105 [bacterium]|nr:MAG: hypothetical protein EPO15_03105 [bacterium]
MTAFSALARLVRALPEPLARTLVDRVMVRSLMMAWPPNRAAARKNLRRVMSHGGTPPTNDALKAALSESLGLYARFLLVMMNHPAEIRAARERMDLALLPALRKLGSARKGVVMVTPNYGLVGHAAWALAESGIPVMLPILNRDFLAHSPPEMREKVFTVGSSASAALRKLQGGDVVLTIADINFLPKRRTTQFFGAPAPLGYAAARLAVAAGSPILPSYATVTGDRCRFEADEPIPTEGRMLEAVQADVARSMERFIGRHPEQWLVYEDFWDVAGMDRRYAVAKRLARWS